MARVMLVAALVLGLALPLVWGLSAARGQPQLQRQPLAEGDEETGEGSEGGSGIDGILESIRTIIREGSEELGIPVLDPFQIKSLGTTVEKIRSYEVDGSLNNVVATGLGDFEANLDANYRIAYFDVTVEVKIPLIQAEGGYNFDALLGEVVHLYGAGDFQLKITELEIKVAARIVPRLTVSNLQTLTTTINGVDFEFKLDGLLEGGLVDGIFNLAVNELAKIIFREQKAVLEEYLAELLFEPIASVVEQFTYQKILCLLLPNLPVCRSNGASDTNNIG